MTVPNFKSLNCTGQAARERIGRQQELENNLNAQQPCRRGSCGTPKQSMEPCQARTAADGAPKEEQEKERPACVGDVGGGYELSLEAPPSTLASRRRASLTRGAKVAESQQGQGCCRQQAPASVQGRSHRRGLGYDQLRIVEQVLCTFVRAQAYGRRSERVARSNSNIG